MRLSPAFAASFLLASCAALAQPDDPPKGTAQDPAASAPSAKAALELPKNTVNLSLALIPFGTYALEYERVHSQRLSFFFSPFFERRTEEWNLGAYVYTKGGGASGGVRYFLIGEAPQGLFIQPQLEIRLQSRLNFDLGRPRETDTTSTVYTAGVGGMGGYTFLIARVVTLSLGIGYQGVWGWSYHDRLGSARLIFDSGFLGRGNLGIAF